MDANDDKDFADSKPPGLARQEFLQQRADALKAQLEAARQDGLIDFADDNLKWKPLRDDKEPADKIPDESYEFHSARKPPASRDDMGCAASTAADDVLSDSDDDQWVEAEL